ncbi:MAG: acetate--CoA ligase family protein [Bacteroidales bacterium]|nr:acetate--CoA ligase family protein [Bacteroidales bacterium]
MINNELLNPASIIVVGGSDNLHKPGGKIIKNLKDGNFKGDIFIINPKENEVQGIKAYPSAEAVPNADLAIIAVAAELTPNIIETLAKEKSVKAFIVISAGFSETTKEGKELEREIVETCNKYGASLIGPNCIGLMNRNHHSVFTLPIPEFDKNGADLISSSGATVVYILESSVAKGLRYNSIWSVGNAAQIGVEDVLEYMDKNFDSENDSKIKLLYIENISNPDKLLLHASSLIRKGCRIAAIKSGSSEAGSRAAASHTGAMASSDLAVEALFRKAGIVRCYSREELTTVGAIFTLKPIKGKNIAIVTHAGGPAVMLTDALSKVGLNVPHFDDADSEELKKYLYPGSSTANPIDILATGTPEQLGISIDFCENHFDNIDAIAVIFGSPGLVQVYDAYRVLNEKIKSCSKPIFPILPSVVTAGEEVKRFINSGNVNFADEVILATAIGRVYNAEIPSSGRIELEGIDVPRLRRIIDGINEDGFVNHNIVREIFACAEIPLVDEFVSLNKIDILNKANQWGYPVVAKVCGIVHKTDVGGVVTNIRSEQHLGYEVEQLMNIKGATGVMIQPMLKGTELFVGASYESRFGHIVMCGLGGIFVEVLKDVASGLAPLSMDEAISMIRSLRAYKIIKGVRGKKGINEYLYAEIIVRLSTILRFATEIKELDINPLIAYDNNIYAVDARIRIEKNGNNKQHS